MGFFARLFGRTKRPVIGRLKPADAEDVALLHADNFDRGWSVPECENLIADATCYGLGARLEAGERLSDFYCAALRQMKPKFFRLRSPIMPANAALPHPC